MSYTASKVLEIARSELGYCEKETNAQLDSKTANAGDNNYTKYARDLAAAGYYNGNKQGAEWCDMFHDHCHYIASGKNAGVAQEVTCQSGPYGAGCKYSAQYYKAQKRFYTTGPKAGDQIFFNNFSHTGIVEKVSNGVITTIEGNSNNKVERRTYSVGSSAIDGYGRPKYAAESTSTTTSTTTVSTDIKKGDIVSVAKNATYYNGKDVPSWVVSEKWVVAATPVGNRVVIDKSSNGQFSINSPINAKYLTVVGADDPWVPDIGDVVNYSDTKHFASANAVSGSPCKGGLAKITDIYQLDKSKHPYHLVRVSGKGATVHGWVDEGSFTKA